MSSQPARQLILGVRRRKCVMGFLDWLFRKRRRNPVFQQRLEELREGLRGLDTHVHQGETDAAESICQRLVAQSAELSASVSTSAEYLPVAEFFFDLAISLRQLKHDRQAEQAYESALRLSTS